MCATGWLRWLISLWLIECIHQLLSDLPSPSAWSGSTVSEAPTILHFLPPRQGCALPQTNWSSTQIQITAAFRPYQQHPARVKCWQYKILTAAFEVRRVQTPYQNSQAQGKESSRREDDISLLSTYITQVTFINHIGPTTHDAGDRGRREPHILTCKHTATRHNLPILANNLAYLSCTCESPPHNKS